MNITVPEKVKEIINAFEKFGYEIYIVGGAVRDVIMGKSVYDWDFTTNATPPEILKLFKDAYYTNDFGTVGIPGEVDEDRPYEITTFRTEYGYSDARRPDKVEWGKTLEEDLKRRDFTINAMALQLETVEQSTKSKKQRSVPLTFVLCTFRLIDYYQGQSDIKDKLIRAVGNPDERFAEDSLRMMRAVRIATEIKFEIEEKTLNAISKNADSIKKISAERIRDELLKILASSHPYEGILLLQKSRLLKIILPEIEDMFGVEQKSPGRHHIYDVGTHSLLALRHVSARNSDPIVRFATLIHDIGKPKTYKVLDNGTITFYNHEIVSANIAKRIADRLRFSNAQKEKLWTLVRYHQFTVDEKQTDSAIRRFIRNVGLTNVEDMLDLRIGDRLGGGATETSWRLEEFKERLVEVQKQPFAIKDLKINGNDVMEILGIPAGPKVGEVLQKIFDEIVENKLPNEKEKELEFVMSLRGIESNSITKQS